MNAVNSISFTIAVLVALLSYIEGRSFKECDKVPQYLDTLYRKMTIERRRSATRYSKNVKRKYFGSKSGTTSGVSWRTSELRMYFNLSSIDSRTKIVRAKLILHRGPTSFRDMIFYGLSYELLVRDANTSKVIYNKTVAKDDSLCLVKKLLRTVRRWLKYPEMNDGLLLSVKDAGRFSTSLETFYPRKNINVPALALFLKPPKISLRRDRLIPSQFIQILSTKTRRSS